MYIFKVDIGDGILTYTFQNSSSGKTGDDAEGIWTFLNAFRKEFRKCPKQVTLSIMNDIGLYFSLEANRFIPAYTTIPLSKD